MLPRGEITSRLSNFSSKTKHSLYLKLQKQTNKQTNKQNCSNQIKFYLANTFRFFIADNYQQGISWFVKIIRHNKLGTSFTGLNVYIVKR